MNSQPLTFLPPGPPEPSRPDGAAVKSPRTWSRIRDAIEFARPERRGIAATMCLSVLAAVITAFEPLVLRDLIDGLSRQAGTRSLIAGSLMLVALLLAHQLVGTLASSIGWRSRLGVQRALLDATVGRLHALPMAYHHNHSAGGLMTRLDRGVQGLTGAFAELAFNVFPAIIYLAVSTLAMARLHGPMTLAILVVLPLPAMWGCGRRRARRFATVPCWNGGGRSMRGSMRPWVESPRSRASRWSRRKSDASCGTWTRQTNW